MYFAEFLNYSSPDRLGISIHRTPSVRGTGAMSSRQNIFGSMESVTSPIGSASCLRLHEGRICLHLALHSPRTTNAWAHLSSAVPPSPTAAGLVSSTRGQPLSTPTLVWTCTWRYRNINLLWIDYASRPRLSSRLTLGGLLPRGTLGFTAEGFLTPLSRLIPVFSLEYAPRRFISVHSKFDAPIRYA